MKQFKDAVEARDMDAVAATLAEDVVFTSPVAFTPYQGKALTASILRGVLRVIDDFKYLREINDENGRDSALVFTGTIDGKEITGCDFLHVNGEGKIEDFVVMVRPLSAAQALAAGMGAEFERIQREATDA